ncbi:MAG: hypothetical protein ACWIPH_09010 [Ostreibacterium sp.]
MKKYGLTPVSSKDLYEIKFSLNSDDFGKEEIKKIKKYLRSKLLNFRFHVNRSQTKLMSWTVFSIQHSTDINCFDENDRISQIILNKAIGTFDYDSDENKVS